MPPPTLLPSLPPDRNKPPAGCNSTDALESSRLYSKHKAVLLTFHSDCCSPRAICTWISQKLFALVYDVIFRIVYLASSDTFSHFHRLQFLHLRCPSCCIKRAVFAETRVVCSYREPSVNSKTRIEGNLRSLKPDGENDTHSRHFCPSWKC